MSKVKVRGEGEGEVEVEVIRGVSSCGCRPGRCGCEPPKAHAHTHQGRQASWELAAGKLFMVGCDRQGLGMSLELPGVCLPHPAAPDQEWCPRFLNPCIDMWEGKSVSFNAAVTYIVSGSAMCPWHTEYAGYGNTYLMEQYL